MRQEINLYGPEFRTQHQPLNGNQILRIGLGFFALLMLVELFVGWQWYSNQQAMAEQNRVYAEVNQRLTRLKQSQPLSQRPRLEAEIENLTQQIERREELRSIISGQNLGNSKGFAHFLQAMARQTVPDIALTDIRLLQGGNYIELDGRVRKPEAVPLYLHQLREESSFQNVRFGVLTIQRQTDDGKGLKFSLGKAKEDS